LELEYSDSEETPFIPATQAAGTTPRPRALPLLTPLRRVTGAAVDVLSTSANILEPHSTALVELHTSSSTGTNAFDVARGESGGMGNWHGATSVQLTSEYVNISFNLKHTPVAKESR
jgi:hypothetical protein